ncbi:MAG: aspartate kinase [Oligoflexia bacterium]|nr:aspartate kinase [Oligoflexia bacterium]
MLIVKKYGGSSVSTPEKIVKIAQHLCHLKNQGHKLIVIVSAMGDTTDHLVELSRQITPTPIQREMDMLLSSGERISMALMSMALNSLGCPAISFTGSQSGVFTNNSHNNASIEDVKAIRVQEELEKNKVVIIAGFQGVNPKTKEVTTLGRGGSDTTAVAMASAFNADRCDILTDVKGIYSCDPRIPGVAPKFFDNLDYEITMEMAYWGARVLHYRSIELAERKKIPLTVHLPTEEGQGTLIGDKNMTNNFENTEIRAVNYSTQAACLKFKSTYSIEEALKVLKEGLAQFQIPIPQIFYQTVAKDNSIELFITAPKEHFDNIQKALSQHAELKTGFATVSVTGRGLVNSNAIFDASSVLAEQSIPIITCLTTALSISFIIDEMHTNKAVQTLHQRFIKS